MALHQEGRLEEADGFYRQILEERPTHPVALRLRGALAYQLGNPDAAVELLGAARRADPNNPEVLTLLGLALDGAGNRAEAEKAYRKALSLAPKSPEIWNNLGALLRDDERLQAAAEAFGKAVVLKPDYVDAYQNLGVTLYRMGTYDAALAAFETGLNVAPGDGELLLNYGVVLTAAGRSEEAAACFEDVLAQAPDDPDALTNLAAAQMRLEDLEGAEETARRALSLAPDSAGAQANLAMILAAARHWEEAEAHYHDALRALPENADIWSNYGNMLMAADRLEEADVAYGRARKYAPGDARHAFQHGLCRLNQGDLAQGWRLYEAGLDCGERVPVTGPKAERWRGEALDGKTLAILPEQGLGDEIRMLSCLPDVLAATGPKASVLVGCDARLQPLIARSFPDVMTVPREALARTSADATIPCGSLPGLFRKDIADFPSEPGYLAPDPDRAVEIAKRVAALGDGPKVGIAWRSGLVRVRSKALQTELDGWLGVLGTAGVQFVSVQYGAAPSEVEGTPVHLFEDLDLKDDLEAAAALTAACDLIVTIGSSVGDIAGALGVPCWTLTAKPAWTTLGAEGHPFYPNTEIFWRMPDEDWGAALSRVSERLRALV